MDNYDKIWHVAGQIVVLARRKHRTHQFIRDVASMMRDMSNYPADSFAEESGQYNGLLLKSAWATAILVNPDILKTAKSRARFMEDMELLLDIYTTEENFYKLTDLLVSQLARAFPNEYEPYPEETENLLEVEIDFTEFDNPEGMEAAFNKVHELVLEKVEMVEKEQKNALGVTPTEIVTRLNDRVVGNAEAKRSVAVHLLTSKAKAMMGEYYKTPHLLLVGGTGTGKTLIVDSVARELGMPFFSIDCSQLTKSGYKGANLAHVLGSWFKDRASARDIKDAAHGADCAELATPGILFLDEFDKMILNERTEYSVQPELLRLLDGGIAQVDAGSSRDDVISVSFRNYSIILAGAFTSVAKEKTKRTVRIGESDKQYDDKLLTVDDLIKAGLMPELAGRIGTIVSTEPFDDWRPVVNLPKGGLRKYYDELFGLMGLDRTVTDEEVDAIIAAGKKRGTGIRGLWAAAEAFYKDVLFF